MPERLSEPQLRAVEEMLQVFQPDMVENLPLVERSIVRLCLDLTSSYRAVLGELHTAETRSKCYEATVGLQRASLDQAAEDLRVAHSRIRAHEILNRDQARTIEALALMRGVPVHVNVGMTREEVASP